MSFLSSNRKRSSRDGSTARTLESELCCKKKGFLMQCIVGDPECTNIGFAILRTSKAPEKKRNNRLDLYV